MEIPTLPRVKIGELQTIMEGAIRICSEFEPLKPAMDTLLAISPEFNNAIIKEQASAEVKNVADEERDNRYSGLYYCSKSLIYYPFSSAEVQETAKQAWDILQDGGKGIIRLPFNEETAAIDSRIAKLRQLNLNVLQGTMFVEMLDLTDKANEKFKSMTLNYIEDKASTASAEAATHLIPQVREALEGLFMMLTTFSRFGNDEKMTIAYNEIVALLKTY